jgi:hypothetical protein
MTVKQLQAMKDNLTASYALGNDIGASATIGWNGGVGFEPIGKFATPFTGRSIENAFREMRRELEGLV